MCRAATSYRIEGRAVRPGVSAATSKEAVVKFDTSALQTEILSGTADLLTMAFAVCLLKNVERFSVMPSFPYAAASIEVLSERQVVPPTMTRIRYSPRLVTDELERRVELLHRNIRQHSTIYNTLVAVCEGRLVRAYRRR